MQTNIDIKELLMRLLAQWKAALLFALLVSIAFTGWKYSKSMSAYNNQLQSRKETTVNATSEEEIQKIYKNLGEDRYLVELVLSQEKLLDEESDYFQHSMLMNSDFENLKTLNIQYTFSYIDESSEKYELVKGYEEYIKSESFVDGLASVIGKTEDLDYISELVFCDELFTDRDYNTSILDINVILPENTDVNAVFEYVIQQVETYKTEAQKKYGDHQLIHLRSEEKKGVFIELAGKQYSVLSNIHNLQTWIKTNKTAMTEDQKAAYNLIKSANTSLNVAETAQNEPVKPSISKKNAIIGFVFGMIMYVICSFCFMASNNKIKSISEAELYSGERLLGELYYSRAYHGMDKLFHSNLVNRILNRIPDDPEIKLDRIGKFIATVCDRDNISEVTLVAVDVNSETGTGYIEKLKEKLSENGIKAQLNCINPEIVEADFLDINNAVIIVHGNETREKELLRFTDICNNFSINRDGLVYFQSI